MEMVFPPGRLWHTKEVRTERSAHGNGNPRGVPAHVGLSHSGLPSATLTMHALVPRSPVSVAAPFVLGAPSSCDQSAIAGLPLDDRRMPLGGQPPHGAPRDRLPLTGWSDESLAPPAQRGRERRTVAEAACCGDAEPGGQIERTDRPWEVTAASQTRLRVCIRSATACRDGLVAGWWTIRSPAYQTSHRAFHMRQVSSTPSWE